MALGIGLPVVLKAHQPGLAPARPGDELEGTRANRTFGGRLEGVWSHQNNRVAHDANWQRRIRHGAIDAHRVLVEDLDAVDVFQPTTYKVVADSGVLDAQHVELHRLGVDLAAVVKQHALAQPEGPGAELFVGLPALGQARDEVAALVDISQAIIHRGSGMYLVVLIVPMRVEASNIGTRAILQYPTPLRMPRRRRPMGRQSAQSSTHQHGTGRGEERSPADGGNLCVSVHGCSPHTYRLYALTSSVSRAAQAVSQTQ